MFSVYVLDNVDNPGRLLMRVSENLTFRDALRSYHHLDTVYMTEKVTKMFEHTCIVLLKRSLYLTGDMTGCCPLGMLLLMICFT